jgi:hypothetical protein
MGGARAWAYSVAWNAAGRLFRDLWNRRRQKFPDSVASKLAISARARGLLGDA